MNEILGGNEIAAANKLSYEITQLTPGHAPVYLATITTGGTLATFVCPACRRPHWHSPEPGHVVAHCSDRAHPHGYVLLLMPARLPPPHRGIQRGDVFPRYPAMTV